MGNSQLGSKRNSQSPLALAGVFAASVMFATFTRNSGASVPAMWVSISPAFFAAALR